MTKTKKRQLIDIEAKLIVEVLFDCLVESIRDDLDNVECDKIIVNNIGWIKYLISINGDGIKTNEVENNNNNCNKIGILSNTQ